MVISDIESVMILNDFVSLVLYYMYFILKFVVENYFILCICYCYEDVKKLILVDWIINMR